MAGAHRPDDPLRAFTKRPAIPQTASRSTSRSRSTTAPSVRSPPPPTFDSETSRLHLPSIATPVITTASYHTATIAFSAASPPPAASVAGLRDSFISIVDDPFFMRLQDHPADPDATADAADRAASEEDEDEDSPEPGDSGDDETPAKKWPPPRRESLIIGRFSSLQPQPRRNQNVTEMEKLNIAIIGATGVGKSSFVQRVIGLPRPPISNTSNLRMVVDNVTYAVTLLELDLESFDMSINNPIQWPKQINGNIVPRVDGALILYDVTEKESIMKLPNTLGALTNSGLPSILVACKCDSAEDEKEVDAVSMANHTYFKSCVANYCISTETPERSRACLHAILRASVSARKGGNGEQTANRRRAASATNLDASDSLSPRPPSQQSKHSRASSDLSLLRGFPNPPAGDQYRLPARSPKLDSSEQSPQHTVSSQLRSPGVRLDRAAHDSFLDMDESDAESHRYSDDIPILQRSDDAVLDRPAKIPGVTFDDLVDRLLALRMTKADHSFADIFLCLYRKFAAPGELFVSILGRLDRVRDDKSMHYLTKTATQLRIIEVVAKWVSLYPGDFARPTTRRYLQEFVRHLSTEPIFALSAQHIRRHLECTVVEDDDTGWARVDDEASEKAMNRFFEKEMELSSTEMFSGISSLHLDEDSPFADRRISDGSEGSHTDRSIGLSGQFHTHSYDEFERLAAKLEPSSQIPMDKAKYHEFMTLPNDLVADAMTHVDWIMFSSIRIRDFVRHVSLTSEQKEKCRSLKNVNRMISHFNHVAKWVANMILLRDKPKHRALMLEKLMSIALKLRQLNNYNGLAAVLAGINGSAIHRLSQTRALVSPSVQKKFARLVILMGTQKSHFAYRLAWENSPLPRIPFVPLHRRDLVSAEEGSRTFVGPQGDRINWKKFEVLGEVILPIMKSQGTPYPGLCANRTVVMLLLDCKMPTDEDEIYQRSVQVESSAGGPVDPVKKKFPWFAM